MEKREVEGYWRQSQDSSSELPWPEPCTDAIWPLLKDNFIVRLEALELRLSSEGKQKFYRGSSICRLCKCINGSREYYTDEWRWPEGYLHYIKEHNVAPSFNFWKMVVDSTPIISKTKFEEVAKEKRNY